MPDRTRAYREPPNLSREEVVELRDLDWLASMLDERFRVPGTNFRFGIDGLIGLVPVFGDTVGTAISGYLLWRATRFGLPKRVIAAMLGNMAVDWLIGLIPFVGDLLDIGFKANRRNVNLLRRHLARRAQTQGAQRATNGARPHGVQARPHYG